MSMQPSARTCVARCITLKKCKLRAFFMRANTLARCTDIKDSVLSRRSFSLKVTTEMCVHSSMENKGLLLNGASRALCTDGGAQSRLLNYAWMRNCKNKTCCAMFLRAKSFLAGMWVCIPENYEHICKYYIWWKLLANPYIYIFTASACALQ